MQKQEGVLNVEKQKGIVQIGSKKQTKKSPREQDRFQVKQRFCENNFLLEGN
jgi:hypothetical protein